MTKKEFKKEILEAKKKELLSLQLTEDYLTYRINGGEKERGNNLTQVQKAVDEAKKQIEFFKK